MYIAISLDDIGQQGHPQISNVCSDRKAPHGSLCVCNACVSHDDSVEIS